MESKIMKSIIVALVLVPNMVFSDTGKVMISHADHSQGQALHGWCQQRSQHLSNG